MSQLPKELMPEHLGYDESLQEVLNSGTDLREYSKEIEKELGKVSNKR